MVRDDEFDVHDAVYVNVHSRVTAYLQPFAQDLEAAEAVHHTSVLSDVEPAEYFLVVGVVHTGRRAVALHTHRQDVIRSARRPHTNHNVGVFVVGVGGEDVQRLIQQAWQHGEEVRPLRLEWDLRLLRAEQIVRVELRITRVISIDDRHDEWVSVFVAGLRVVPQRHGLALIKQLHGRDQRRQRYHQLQTTLAALITIIGGISTTSNSHSFIAIITLAIVVAVLLLLVTAERLMDVPRSEELVGFE
mmetsp:Transcript_34863/g.86526  ORF Transcript_34863/g.86526 Transcript_34863/m.86526 type:complete len:246 (+) Transcript_34863:406-1143(+)